MVGDMGDGKVRGPAGQMGKESSNEDDAVVHIDGLSPMLITEEKRVGHQKMCYEKMCYQWVYYR